MEIASYSSTGAETHRALADIAGKLPSDTADAQMVFVFYGCGHDDTLIHDFARRRFPAAAVMGGTSSGGLMTEKGFLGENGIGFLVIRDAEGEYGAASGPLGDAPEEEAARALNAALASCDCIGQLPELIWIYQAPGHEEAVIRGLRRIVGDHCPIVGGSSGDNTVGGHWRQIGPSGPMSDGLVVGVLFPSAAPGIAFQGGYEPAGPQGTITRMGFRPAGESGIVTSTAGREIVLIDDEPAAEVYDRWTDHLIRDKFDTRASILADTTMYPLATEAGQIGGVTQYLLIHPDSITPERGLTIFRDLTPGTRVFAMRGDRGQLVERAGRVSSQARRGLQEGVSPAGALVVYCGGCKIAVGDEIGSVARSISENLGDAPFIGCFTFGEQGYLIDQNVHGNLMISAIVFGK